MFVNTAVWQRQTSSVPVYLGCSRINDKSWFTLPQGTVETVDGESKIMPPHIWGRFHVSYSVIKIVGYCFINFTFSLFSGILS